MQFKYLMVFLLHVQYLPVQAKGLRKVRKESGLDDSTYKYMYPTGHNAPKLYSLHKIHKLDTPLRPIMSSWQLVMTCMEWLRY